MNAQTEDIRLQVCHVLDDTGCRVPETHPFGTHDVDPRIRRVVRSRRPHKGSVRQGTRPTIVIPGWDLFNTVTELMDGHVTRFAKQDLVVGCDVSVGTNTTRGFHILDSRSTGVHNAGARVFPPTVFGVGVRCGIGRGRSRVVRE